MVSNQLKESDPTDVEKSAAEKPLLQLPQDCSDKQVNMTVTSMDSALSNSDNCSDIEMENIQHKIHPTPPPTRRNHSPSPPSQRNLTPSPPPTQQQSSTTTTSVMNTDENNLSPKSSSPTRDSSKD